MSWLFGGNKQTTKEEDLKQTLGFDPAQVSDVSSIINSPGVFDASRLHPLAGLDKGVEYLDLKDEQLNDIEGSKGLIPSRSWTDDLCYGTGAVYLLGLGLGGAYGFQEGVKNLPKNAPPRLQLNTILNHMTKRGPFLGNSAGVLALTYNMIDSSLDYFRGVHDDFNSLGAGAIAGALFRSSAGLRPMAYSTALMTGAAGAWCGVKHLLK
ncbi:mitochondrial import inner membrane translocase subunit TIM23 [Suhomyces tanzawaensis NRRL Y-17324]|uniref:Mitochondrial import inner membrane translocase subunit TIM23 n=1 Tax=Suhomyces tanzawaensis NRRL Y-17324 TaxID=984487 RepID=A0A1E4SSC5_9ASCO|nr:mitochondrial import inner membrane translocase subunit TIM23 [Suhomyces tanzawaensis NRRL Y-17324]ODV82401.1 mitochondrial import inner membrane translocase subunit TIM23 [Suhomyces tanzawaensis NRRL Y-17324]